MRVRDAKHMLVNALDRHEALLGELVSSFKIGDVLGLERDGLPGQIIAWVIGQTVHRGGFYRIPVKVRSVEGAFASHDLVTLHRLEDEALKTPRDTGDTMHVANVASVASPTEKAGNSPPEPEPVIRPVAFPPPLRTELATLKQQAITEMADPTPILNRIASIETYLDSEVAVEFAIRASNPSVDQATRQFARGFIDAEARVLGKDTDTYIRELIAARATRQAQIMGDRLTRMRG